MNWLCFSTRTIGVLVGLFRSSILISSIDHIVYGGSPRGIMGRISRTLAELGGDVIGIKPRPFLKYSNGKLPEWGYNELVPDIHTQKARMAELSNGYLFLPGGFRTLGEFCAFRMRRKLGEYTPWKIPKIFSNIQCCRNHKSTLGNTELRELLRGSCQVDRTWS